MKKIQVDLYVQVDARKLFANSVTGDALVECNYDNTFHFIKLMCNGECVMSFPCGIGHTIELVSSDEREERYIAVNKY